MLAYHFKWGCNDSNDLTVSLFINQRHREDSSFALQTERTESEHPGILNFKESLILENFFENNY